MEVTEALRVPLAPARMRVALSDFALLRASLDNCESFTRTPNSEYALTLVVPLGALRHPGASGRAHARRISYRRHRSRRRRADLELQGARRRRRLAERADRGGAQSRGRGRGDVHHTVWATVAGPLAAAVTASDRKRPAQRRRRFLRRVLRSGARQARLVGGLRGGGAVALVPASRRDVGGFFAPLRCERACAGRAVRRGGGQRRTAASAARPAAGRGQPCSCALRSLRCSHSSRRASACNDRPKHFRRAPAISAKRAVRPSSFASKRKPQRKLAMPRRALIVVEVQN